MHVFRSLILAICMSGLSTWGGSPSFSAAAEADAPPAISPLATSAPRPEPIEPLDSARVQQAIERGVDFLLADQRPDGGWGSAENTKGLNIYAPVPGAHHGFKLAVTALALEGLSVVEPLLDGERRARVAEAIGRGTDWLLQNHERVRRAEPTAIYNVWGHAYAIQAFAALHRRAGAISQTDRQEQFQGAIQVQAEKLARYAYVNGGWGYYDFMHHTQVPGGSPTSFTTATALIALDAARELGVEFPEKLTQKALASIERQRNPDFTYSYSDDLRMYPRFEINRPAGSLGRSQACNEALRLYGDQRATDEVLQAWLDRLFARNGWLSLGRKRPIPHESYFAVAGYFYYYGHYYAALAIELLPEAQRTPYWQLLAHTLVPLQERDGSWWDYPFYNYHQQYGTAMALVALGKSQLGLAAKK